MFQGIEDSWIAVALSRSITSKPVSFTIAETPVALFRDRSGTLHGLLDRCPHRGVKLSLGRVDDQGCLVCPFHGWAFGGDGACTHVPWNPDAKRHTLAAIPVPVVERGGLVWLFTRAGRSAVDDALRVPAVFDRADIVVTGDRLRWNTHWTRAMENMLDWPHLPFVHQRTIGRGMRGARMDITWDERDDGGHGEIDIDGVRQEGSMDFYAPNGMALSIMDKPRTLSLFVSVIPVSDRVTDMLLVSARSFLRPRLFDPIFRKVNRTVAAEDKAIIESSSPAEVPAPSEERSVRTDKPTLAFRRRYLDDAARRTKALPIVSSVTTD